MRHKDKPHLEDPPWEMYVLDGHTPVLTTDPKRWETSHQKAYRTIAQTDVHIYQVQTVFYGVCRPPNTPSTMFHVTIATHAGNVELGFCPDDYLDIPQSNQWEYKLTVFRSCATWEEAEQLHSTAVQHCQMLVDLDSRSPFWWLPPQRVR